MNCDITSKLYIRANGDIPCYDDAGEKIILGHVSDADEWTIESVLNNASYAQIRERLGRGETPWPDACNACALFRPKERFFDSIASRVIKTLQIEASLACQLSCPGCSQSAQIRMRPKPFRLSPDLFRAALRSLSAEGYDVGEIEYCGQGEPLTHSRFRELVDLGREYYPATPQRLITSGNFLYERVLAGTAVDEIFVSCDGLRPDSYAKYRIGGDVDRVLRFMADVPKQVNGRKQKVIWKYILFEFNDSDEELRAAQEKAAELDVDCLLFVFTHSKFKSNRYTLANASELPVYGSNVVVNGTPIHYQYFRSFSPRSGEAVRARAPRFRWRSLGRRSHDCILTIDALEQLTETKFALRGWALAKEPISHIRFARNQRIIGTARRVFRGQTFNGTCLLTQMREADTS